MAAARGGEMAQALSTLCGPRPRGLGACPSEGPVQGPLQSHGDAGRVYPWTQAAQRS
jgi:hypothetical protein